MPPTGLCDTDTRCSLSPLLEQLQTAAQSTARLPHWLRTSSRALLRFRSSSLFPACKPGLANSQERAAQSTAGGTATQLGAPRQCSSIDLLRAYPECSLLFCRGMHLHSHDFSKVAIKVVLFKGDKPFKQPNLGTFGSAIPFICTLIVRARLRTR